MPGYPDRCQHIKVNGTQCGSPALRRNKFCYFHKRFREQRIPMNGARARRRCATLDLPLLEDANSIQIALMEILRLLALGHLDTKTAGLYFYALQTASANLRRLDLQPLRHDVVLNPRDVDQTPLGGNLWEDEDFEEDDEEEEEEAITLTASEKSAILAAREGFEKDKRSQLLMASNKEESDSIRRKFGPNSPEYQHTLMKRLSAMIGGPTPPSVKEIRENMPKSPQ
jgi:hypothetical protein